MSNFLQNMETLQAINPYENLIEVSEEGKITKVTFLGRLIRFLSSLVGGKGFSDCKCSVVAERIDNMIQENLDAFAKLNADNKRCIWKSVNTLSNKRIISQKSSASSLPQMERLLRKLATAAAFPEAKTADDLRARWIVKNFEDPAIYPEAARINALALAISDANSVMVTSLASSFLEEGKTLDGKPDLQKLLVIAAVTVFGTPTEMILNRVTKPLVTKLEDLDVNIGGQKDAQLSERFRWTVANNIDKLTASGVVTLSEVDRGSLSRR